uniref:cDNA FLJ26522 fis, clone KDN08064 n=1 Tax=Homo sapiens TaxID=9606 RepID=Q6ZP43_HUMAN|nr:unnamed protein product [Homo sapiens]
MLVGAQSLEGAEVAGGWCISTTLSAFIPGWVMTAPRLGHSFAPKLEQGEPIRWEQALLSLWGQEGFPGPQECRDAWVCSSSQVAAAVPGRVGLQPLRLRKGWGSHLLCGACSLDCTSPTAAGVTQQPLQMGHCCHQYHKLGGLNNRSSLSYGLEARSPKSLVSRVGFLQGCEEECSMPVP